MQRSTRVLQQPAPNVAHLLGRGARVATSVRGSTSLTVPQPSTQELSFREEVCREDRVDGRLQVVERALKLLDFNSDVRAMYLVEPIDDGERRRRGGVTHFTLRGE